MESIKFLDLISIHHNVFDEELLKNKIFHLNSSGYSHIYESSGVDEVQFTNDASVFDEGRLSAVLDLQQCDLGRKVSRRLVRASDAKPA